MKMRRCEDEKRICEDVKMRRCEDDMCRCENERMICVDVKMRRCEERCEDERMRG